MIEEQIAWISADGELTESKSLMERWKRVGRDFIGLTQEQYDLVNKLYAKAEALRYGYIARFGGEPKSTNPYSSPTDEFLHVSWLQGWRHADNDPHAPKQSIR